MLLKKFADNFRKQNGRYPNLWLDSSCIDINDSMCKGFVYISVYMMLCDKLLIFISRTWLTRIWCILEPITFGAFCHSIEDRVNVILVDEIESVPEILNRLNNFSFGALASFDPNQEADLRKCLYAIGIKKCCSIMRDIAKAIKKKIMLPSGDEV